MVKKHYGYLIRYIKLVLGIGKAGIFVSFLFMISVTCVNILLPKFVKQIIDEGIEGKNINYICIHCFLYLFFIITSNGINMILENYYGALKLKASTQLKRNFIDKLVQANGKYLSNQKTGNVLRILDNDIFQVENFGIDLLLELVMNFVTAVVVFVIMLRLNPLLLFIIVVIQILMLLFQYVISMYITSGIKKVREIAGDQSNLQEEFISNIKNAILTNVTDYFQEIFCQNQADFVKQSKKVNLLISIHSKFASSFNSLGTILTYFIGGIMIVNDRMSLGELIAFTQYTAMLIAPCMFFISSSLKIKQTNVSLEKIYSEMDSIGLVVDKKGCLECVHPIEKIEFANVNFSYSNMRVINRLNLSLLRNEVTIIIGESGCGKSTLLNLLYRLWSPDSGMIFINNKEIGEYSVSSLRKKICIVSQDVLIFNNEIKENIRMNNRQVSDSIINNICNIVGLSSLITSEDEMIGTGIGEGGSKISGGQKQRIAIARALIKKCDVLIFDESTSAIDNISQKHLMDKITPFFEGKIVIMIAHRMSLAKYADKIVVMKNGTVIESGGHKELMDYKGVYYTMSRLT